MSLFLKDLLHHKKALLKKKKPLLDNLMDRMKGVSHTRYSLFKRAIVKPGQVNLIAEIKKASPSKGLIRQDFDALKIAKAYTENGAAALSVLTEEKYFLGKLPYLKKVSDRCELPVLAKDFFLEEGQIYEAKVNGASAVLLIAVILDKATLRHLLATAHSLDMDCLVEIHTALDLNKALDCGAEIIGINNRDLNTFEVNLRTSEELVPRVPTDKVIVAESGISQAAEVQRLGRLGVQAVLIGETFMRADDIGAKVREIMTP